MLEDMTTAQSDALWAAYQKRERRRRRWVAFKQGLGFYAWLFIVFGGILTIVVLTFLGVKP